MKKWIKCCKVYGVLDGTSITLARILQKRNHHRSAYIFWEISNRIENHRFEKLLKKYIK